MRVLVTGASGFAGAVAAREIAAAGHAVTALHRSHTRFLATLDGVPGISFAQSDLAAAAALTGPFDAIVHTAATSPAPVVDTARMVRDNAIGTLALIEAAERWQSQSFVLYSSLSLYGEITTATVDESTSVHNPDAYGCTKLLCETMLKERSAHLPGLALRLPGVLGPGAHRNWMSGVAARLIAGEKIRAFSLDRPFNNAAHVANIAALARSVIERGWTGFDAVVLGARGSITVRGAIERLAEGLGVSAQIEEVASSKPSFVLSSDRAITRWGYDPMDICDLITRYAAEQKVWLAAS